MKEKLYIKLEGAPGTGKTTALSIIEHALKHSNKFKIVEKVQERRTSDGGIPRDADMINGLVVELY